jgi:hypothetical protein
MSRWPKRPLNRCQTCGYTWHPRGKDRSLVCPNCHSRQTEVSLLGCLVPLALALLMTVGFVVGCGGVLACAVF